MISKFEIVFPEHLILSNDPNDVKIVWHERWYDDVVCNLYDMYFGKKFICTYMIDENGIHICGYTLMFDPKCLAVLTYLFPNTKLDYSCAEDFNDGEPIVIPDFEFTIDPCIFCFMMGGISGNEFFDSIETFERITGEKVPSCWFANCQCSICEKERWDWLNKD